MFRIADKRGYSYYMTSASLPEYYQGYDNKLAGAASFIKHEAEQGGWIKCYIDSMLRHAVAVRANEIYVIQEENR